MPRPSLGTAPNPNADPNAKDKFKNLDSDFKDAVAQSSAEDIYKRITELSNQLEDLDKAKKADQDLIALKEKVATAMEPYKAASKDLKLRIKFALQVLGDQGKL